MKIVWRGVDQNLLTYGAGKGFSFDARTTTIQDAIDSISDAADSNRYLVLVAPGYYQQHVGLDQSWISLAGEDRDSVIIHRDDDHELARWGYTGPTKKGGGGISIAPDTSGFVEGVGLYNLTAVRTFELPPEAGVFLGHENDYRSTLPYDRIEIIGCRILGKHDGYQQFGTNNDYTGIPPRVLLAHNWIGSNHDAMTLKGSSRLTTRRNYVRADADGLAPFLTGTISTWKTTGFHCNVAHYSDSATSTTPNPRGYVDSLGDTFDVRVRSADNIDTTADQSCYAGILFYHNQAFTGITTDNLPPHRFMRPRIRVRYDADATPPRGVAGVLVDFTASSNSFVINPDELQVLGATIDVAQLNTGTSAPGTVSAVEVDGGSGAGSVVGCQVTGWANVVNAKGGGNAYSLRTVGSADRIEHRLYSDQAKDIGSGTIAALAEV